MPRLTRSIPSYRKHRASGQAVVTLGGRDFYLGPYGTRVSRNEYDRLVGEWLRQGRQSGRQLADDRRDAPELCVTQLIVAYLHFAQGYYRKRGRPTSEYTAIVHALRHVKRLYGRKPVSDFGPVALQTVIQQMVGAGWARGTINEQAGRIKRMFRWGVSQELIPAHLSDALASVAGFRKGRTEARKTGPILPAPATMACSSSECAKTRWSALQWHSCGTPKSHAFSRNETRGSFRPEIASTIEPKWHRGRPSQMLGTYVRVREKDASMCQTMRVTDSLIRSPSTIRIMCGCSGLAFLRQLRKLNCVGPRESRGQIHDDALYTQSDSFRSRAYYLGLTLGLPRSVRAFRPEHRHDRNIWRNFLGNFGDI